MLESRGDDGNGTTVPLLPEKGNGPSVERGGWELWRRYQLRAGGCHMVSLYPARPLAHSQGQYCWHPGQGLMGDKESGELVCSAGLLLVAESTNNRRIH